MESLLPDPDELRRAIAFDENALCRLAISAAQIEEERTLRRNRIAVNKALLCPFRRLPLELVVAIFKECLPDKWPFTPSSVRAPLLLCRVSRTWRTLALSSPALWSEVHLPAGPTNEEHTLSLLGLYLARSKEAQVTVVVGFPSFDQSIPAPYASRLLAQLIPHAHRWRCLKLERTIGVDILFMFGHIPCDTMRSLEKFELSVTRKVPGSTVTSPPTNQLAQCFGSFASAVSLRSLILDLRLSSAPSPFRGAISPIWS